MLARMHAIYENRVDAFSGLYLVDEIYLNHAIDHVLAALPEIKSRLMGSDFEEIERRLATTRNNSQIKNALKQLPLTLTHGDVHPGNLIKNEKSQAVLIDWGNARRAPAALDLANTVKLDSLQWELYLDFCDEAHGKPVDRRLAVLGYYWATIQINLNYLPFAIANRPVETTLDMIEKIMEAQSCIAETI
jgi:thiamine kinase-like enzyme